ncbi:fatty acid desaturase [uncultured Litoreibacter sp.]|uniref:fatty acid desaturase n=1 Tax=uncultured Litoreibacter sp. TaxID=1392394 RepID=UPI00260765CC|nr:fatty acid desaturase [uncultured Litoreibacter sp.]
MARDYSLSGDAGAAAVASGLASPNWYRPDIPPAEIRALMTKSDAIALRDTGLWIGALLGFAAAAVALWPSWWSAPFWLGYGVLYGSAADSRWHECGHKTAFRTAWMNSVVYHIASFMMMRNPVIWRASHVRHHTDTIIVGRDPEIVAMRPPDLGRIALNMIGLIDVPVLLGRMVMHSVGRIQPDEAMYLRDADRSAAMWAARVHLAIYICVAVAAVVTWSILPLMLIGLPRFYGAWHHVMTGVLQHLGLAENVTDHRLNTRTVLMNPVSRFIYLNMNYHLEHHVFTMVPYYRLPQLHELVKHDFPAPDQSIAAAFRRLMPVLWRQLRYEDAVILPDLPAGATPYRDEVERLRPFAA